MSVIKAIENITKEIDNYLIQISEGEERGISDSSKAKRVSIIKSSRGDRDYFYSQKSNKGKLKRIYLGTADSDLVKQARNDQLNAALSNVLSYDKEILEKCGQGLKPFDLHALEQYISPCLRGINTEFVLNEEVQKLWDWASEDYQKNTAPFPKRKIYAEDGTRVRSKGECLWFNEFIHQWVPKRYDPLIELDNPKPGILGPGEYVWVSPDFLLKCLDGTYIIVEHLGYLMDDKYANDFRDKLQIYLYNGFIPGVNLFILSDDVNGGTDSQAIKEMVERIKQRIFCSVL